MIGRELGNYRILKELGKGGMGVVYKAHQLSLGRPVAMKVLPTHLTSDPSFVKRFQNEARAIAKLNHPNIVQIYDIGHEDDIHYYTMEFIEGPTLDEMIYKEGFLSSDRTLTIISQVSKALQYAHSQGIVHRDIKPSNIMIAKSGRVKVTDFGLALQQRTTRLTVDGGIVGTPEYMSPEQAGGRTATAQSDIYSLGVVAYELLTGAVPFEGESPLMVLNKIQNSEPQWPRAVNPGLPIEFENIIRKMMAKDPADRYSSCQELLQDTQRIRLGQPVSALRQKSTAIRLIGAGAVVLGLLVTMALAIAFILRAIGDDGKKTGEQPPAEEKPPVVAVAVNPPPEQNPPGPISREEPEGPAEKISPRPPEKAARPIETQKPQGLPSSLERPDDMRQMLTAMEQRLNDLKLAHKQGEGASLGDGVEAIKRALALVESRLEELSHVMYPDMLILEKGNEIRGKISGESLLKVHFDMPLGTQLISRDRVKLTAYATEADNRLSAELLKIGENVKKLRKDVNSFDRMLEPPRHVPPVAIERPEEPDSWEDTDAEEDPDEYPEESIWPTPEELELLKEDLIDIGKPGDLDTWPFDEL